MRRVFLDFRQLHDSSTADVIRKESRDLQKLVLSLSDLGMEQVKNKKVSAVLRQRYHNKRPESVRQDND